MKKIRQRKHVLVAGDMGVGKTKIAVDFIANMIWHQKIKRALVVVPLEAVGVWEEQLTNNCPFVNYSLYLKNENPSWAAQVIIVNYDYLCPRRKKRKPTERMIRNARVNGKKLRVKKFVDKRILESIVAWAPNVVVIDEGHKIKKPTARRSKAIHALGPIAEYTIDLTGTPTGNKKVMDLWSQFRFLKGDLLDEDYKDFKQKYGIWTGFGNFTFVKPRNLKQLSRIIAPYTIRIKKTGLPQKNFIRYPVILPPHAKTIYKQMEEELVAYVSGQRVVAPIVLTKMMKLSQIAGGFIKNEKKEDISIHTAKISALKNILEELRENGTNRVVIFARFLWELEEVKKALNEQGWNNIYRVRGRVPQDVMSRYNSEGGAMVCQTQSGSGSNNFQAGNYMIFYSTDYSLINFNQGLDRIHRIGQDKPCFYYFLQARGTIDIRIYNLLRENKEVSDQILSLMEEIKSDHQGDVL